MPVSASGSRPQRRRPAERRNGLVVAAAGSARAAPGPLPLHQPLGGRAEPAGTGRDGGGLDRPRPEGQPPGHQTLLRRKNSWAQIPALHNDSRQIERDIRTLGTLARTHDFQSEPGSAISSELADSRENRVLIPDFAWSGARSGPRVPTRSRGPRLAGQRWFRGVPRNTGKSAPSSPVLRHPPAGTARPPCSSLVRPHAGAFVRIRGTRDDHWSAVPEARAVTSHVCTRCFRGRTNLVGRCRPSTDGPDQLSPWNSTTRPSGRACARIVQTGSSVGRSYRPGGARS